MLIQIIKELFGLGRGVQDILHGLEGKRKEAKGLKNRVLYEMEFNSRLVLDHYLERGADAGKIILQLRLRHLATAIDDGVDFKKIKEGEIDSVATGNIRFFKYYIGDDCEAFAKRIRSALDDLKVLPDLYDLTDLSALKRVKNIDIHRRLQNLGKLYLLFARFIGVNPPSMG